MTRHDPRLSDEDREAMLTPQFALLPVEEPILPAAHDDRVLALTRDVMMACGGIPANLSMLRGMWRDHYARRASAFSIAPRTRTVEMVDAKGERTGKHFLAYDVIHTDGKRETRYLPQKALQ